MQFAYKRLTGNFTATAMITNRVDPASGSRWGQHGIMARDSTAIDSRMIHLQTNLASDGEPVDEPRIKHRPTNGDAEKFSTTWISEMATPALLPSINTNRRYANS